MSMEPRKLKGHKTAATCCLASRDRPGFVATGGEDGRVCWFDMRCRDVQTIMDIGMQPISCLCFKSGNEDVLCISSGNVVDSFDMRIATPEKPMRSYKYNKEEINQIVCNSKAAFLASADDSGDAKIIDIRQDCPYKTLRGEHSSICSTVQFVPWKPWDVITGGLDSKIVVWNFSSGRPLNVLDLGKSNASSHQNQAQCLNPPFVHSLVVPDLDMLDKTKKICVAGRGDGIVDVIDMDDLTIPNRNKSRKGSQSNSKNSDSTADASVDAKNRKRLNLGGHKASVSCVTFSLFGEKGKYIISGGNDKSVKVWDYTRYIDDVESTPNSDILTINISMHKKVNWLCTTPNESENLIVCDTSKIVKAFSVL